MNQDPFKEYKKQTEPGQREKSYAWHTAIGLQDVDGLTPSRYLIDTAIKNIEGKITFDEAQTLLDSYYKENPSLDLDDRTEEADKVSIRIARILSEKAFSFTPNEYISIHKRLFAGIYQHAGRIRDYNITKKEWILNGETVLYGSAAELRETLKYDFAQEREYDYRGLSMDEIIHHLALFVSRLWQIHIFSEGNTRTTAVFFIKYLRTLGFDATNDIFAEHAWYFRNALVRANYNDLKNGIHETTEYLELFLRNLLLDEKNELHNRTMHVSRAFQNYKKADTKIEKPDIGAEKSDIDAGKADIEMGKPYIGTGKSNIDTESLYINDARTAYADSLPCEFTKRTISHIKKMYDTFGVESIFGRSDVEAVLGLKSARVSELLKKLLEIHLIQPVSGHGKGKYRFAKIEIKID